MTRTRLPNRRKHQTVTLDWHGQEWTLGIGFDGDRKVKELFLNGPHAGSDQEALAQDGAVLASLLLQSGVTVAELAQRVAREGPTPESPVASLLGLAATRAAEIEAAVATKLDEGA